MGLQILKSVNVRLRQSIQGGHGPEWAAVGRGRGAGFTSTTDTYPSDPSLCTVESQDPEGSADLGAEISLTLDCLDEDDGY